MTPDDCEEQLSQMCEKPQTADKNTLESFQLLVKPFSHSVYINIYPSKGYLWCFSLSIIKTANIYKSVKIFD